MWSIQCDYLQSIDPNDLKLKLLEYFIKSSVFLEKPKHNRRSFFASSVKRRYLHVDADHFAMKGLK